MRTATQQRRVDRRLKARRGDGADPLPILSDEIASEEHGIADHDTSATAADLDTLTAGITSKADTLHKHNRLADDNFAITSPGAGQLLQRKAAAWVNVSKTLAGIISSDGTVTYVADQPMGSNKITGLADGTASDDAAAFGQVPTTVAELDTGATGTELDTLTDGSDADTLHTHSAGNLTGMDWADWTPTLTASTTSPTLGSGSSVQGRYVQMGKTVIAWAKINFGTSGANAGSGTYFISLPRTAATEFNQSMGSGFITCAGTGYNIVTWFNTTSTMRLKAPGSTNITAAVPGTWTNNDLISVVFMYEAA